MRPIRWLRRGVTLLGLGVTGTAVAVTARHVLETPQPLESVLPGEGKIDHQHGGSLFYNVAGPRNAAVLVLLHDFYPGASNAEFRRVFASLARDFRVYAPDWLGFGLSEHPTLAYTGEFFAGLLTGFLRDVVGQRASVLAQGRAANVAVRAASDTPALFERLVLVAPDARAGMELDPTPAQVLARAAQRVALGLVPYAALSTRIGLRVTQAMRHAERAGAADQATTERLYASAHQFGGQHALIAQLTGALDLPIQNALALLEPPALLVAGANDAGHPQEEMEDLAILSPHTDLEIIPDAGEAVADDQPELLVAAVVGWLRSPRARSVVDEAALLDLMREAAEVEAEVESEVALGRELEDEEDEAVAELVTDELAEEVAEALAGEFAETPASAGELLEITAEEAPPTTPTETETALGSEQVLDSATDGPPSAGASGAAQAMPVPHPDWAKPGPAGHAEGKPLPAERTGGATASAPAAAGDAPAVPVRTAEGQAPTRATRAEAARAAQPPSLSVPTTGRGAPTPPPRPRAGQPPAAPPRATPAKGQSAGTGSGAGTGASPTRPHKRAGGEGGPNKGKRRRER